MVHRIQWLLVLVILLAGGIFAPPALHAMGTKDPPVVSGAGRYLLFTGEYEGSRCTILQMDTEGNLTFRAEYNVGGESSNIAASPDGRVVAVSGLGQPALNLFFIGEDGSVSPPLGLDNLSATLHRGHDNPVVFHPTQPLIYVGYRPISCYRYNLTQRQTEPTSSSLQLDYDGPPQDLFYSVISNTLAFYKNWLNPDPNYTPTPHSLQTVHIKPDGTFGSLAHDMPFSTYINSDMAMSPDGRWLVATTLAPPKVRVVGIDQDGISTVTQQISYRVSELPNYTCQAFMPDSRGMLMLCQGGPYVLRYYELDPGSGTLTLRGGLPGWDTPGGLVIPPPTILALTPDGRFAVFRAQSFPDLAYDTLYVVRIHPEDWSLELLDDKTIEVDRHLSSMGFGLLPQTATGSQWALYE